jgi:vacuolar-type H+-ATPase subunit H
MKIVKRLLLALLILVILLTGAAVAIPYFYKDEILALLKDEINNTVNAEVNFADVELSLFKSFPNLNLTIEDFSVTGKENFDGVTLAAGESVSMSLDLMSVIRSSEPVAVRSVSLESPDINVYVLKDGTANYDITLPTDTPLDTTAESTADYSNVVVKLDRYSISNGRIFYDDKSIDVFFEAEGINHEGNGNFTIDVYDLDTETSIESMTVSQAGITYLKEALVTLDAIFNIDQPNSKYTLKDNELKVNELMLDADGFVQLSGDDVGMELTFSTPQNNFKSLLSLIPNAYIEGYEDVKADGQFTLSGKVNGTYNAVTESMPAFQVDLTVADASVQYPGLPMGISNIATEAHINSPSSDFDQLTVDVPQFRMRLGNNPFLASFNLKTPISDPDVKASAKGVINLADISKAFPVEGVNELNGIINADMKVNTRLSTIEREAYEQVDMSGSMKVEQMAYKGEGLPRVQINSMQMDFTPKSVNIPEFEGKLGQSDLQASGRIDNILAYFSPEKTMKGTLKMRSNYFNADEWVAEPAESENPPTPSAISSSGSSGTATAETEIFDRFDFTLDAAIDKIVYDVYEINNSVAIGNIKPNRLEVSKIATQIGDSDFAGSGVITGLFDYTFEEGILGGQLDLKSNKIDLNQFMEGYEGESSTATSTTAGSGTTEASYSTIPVPPNINMTVNASVGQLNYTDLELKQVNGKMVIADEAVVVENVSAKGLGGQLGMSGSYDTKDIEKPEFSFKYDLQNLDFQQAFTSFNTFEQLAPIGKFIKGNFNSTLIMDGQLGKNMMPVIESINAEGFLQTLNGVIQNFKPAQAIGEKLNVKLLKENIKIVNTKNWFEIAEGRLELKEYDAKIDDIKMKIGGSYSLASLMDLDIKAQIPRSLLESNAIGAAASSGIGLLQKEASKLGLNIEQGDMVNVLINLKGAITDPSVGLKLLGIGGEGDQSMTDALKKEAKEQAQEAIDEVKDKAKDAAQQAADSIKNLAEERARKAREEAEKKAREEAKKKLEEALDSNTKEAVDKVLDKVDDEKIKEHLDEWNPFKKKKKGGG